MFDNVKNRLRGVATEKQPTNQKGKDRYYVRDAHGRMVDAATNEPVAGNLERDEVTDDDDA